MALIWVLAGTEALARTPGEVCSAMASRNSSNAVICVQLISSAYIDGGAADVTFTTLQSSTSDPLACLRAASNHSFSPWAAHTCDIVAG